MTEAGQTQGNLSKVLQRLPAMGSVLFLVPGPKMMWHFGELVGINHYGHATMGMYLFLIQIVN